jgi:hypothetical protein
MRAKEVPSQPVSTLRRLSRAEAWGALPAELQPVYDKLCEETLHWSKYYYGSSFISYSILKELVEDGWTKIPKA